MQMYHLEDDTEYIDLTRPGMHLRNHDGIKLKSKPQKIIKCTIAPTI